MLRSSRAFRQYVAQRTALAMFALSLLFLAVVAALVVLWVDVPRLDEAPATGVSSAGSGDTVRLPVVPWLTTAQALEAGFRGLTFLYAMWPFFLLEFLFQYLIRDTTQPFWRTRYWGLVICLCPPLRLCARNDDMGGRIWLPGLGWRRVNENLRKRLERIFSVPMIFIALAILPVLLVELGMKHQVAARPWLQFVLHVSLGVIWFAFAAEFIVMVSVAKKKLRYCREHWLDIAIILLPLISFLRSLRAVRALRVARLARLEQLARMSRLYRMRGLAMRTLRALLLLKIINRLLPTAPEKQLMRLRELLKEKEAEIVALRREIAELEKVIAAQEQPGEAATK